MSLLQLEEDNLKKNDGDLNNELNVAFTVKIKQNKSKGRLSIDELKKRTKCNICGSLKMKNILKNVWFN